MNVEAAVAELRQLVAQQGFTATKTRDGQWLIEHEEVPHHVLTFLDSQDSLLRCVEELLGACGLRRTPQVAAYLTRWKLYPTY